MGYTVVLPPQPFGQLPRWGAKNVLPLNLTALPEGGKQVAATLILIAFVCRLKVLLIEIRNTKRLGDISAFVLHTAPLLSAPLGHLPIGKADDTRIAPAKDHRSTHFHSLKSNNQK